MSHALYRLGRFAARRPGRVIGAWFLVAIVVVGASAGFGRDLEDSFDVSGLDSQDAIDLLSAARSDRAGLTAQVVATPLANGATFADDASAAALSDLRGELEALESVLGTAE